MKELGTNDANNNGVVKWVFIVQLVRLPPNSINKLQN